MTIHERVITSHFVDGQPNVNVYAEKKLCPGNIPHNYRITAEDKHTCQIHFQEGPVKDVGINGITHEALLAVLRDRLLHFQAGSYACTENDVALHHISSAIAALNCRTEKRIIRNNTEGRSEK